MTLANGWIISGALFVAFISIVGLYCKLGLMRLDKEDAEADERQKGIL